MGLKNYAASVGAALLLASAGATDQVAAATVQFASLNWGSSVPVQPKWLLTIDDIAADPLHKSLNLSIAFPTTPPALLRYKFDTELPCGSECRFTIARWGDQGSLSGVIAEFVLTISDTTASAVVNYFGRPGVRSQIIETVETPATVPLPAALPLFMAGLAGLGFVGWRKRRSALAAA